MKVKKNKMKTNKYMRVIKDHSSVKPACKVYRKRIMMLTRRLIAVMEEKKALEEKNKDILDCLKSEKGLNASLRKESFYYQRLYHEEVLAVNSYKVKQDGLTQVMRTCSNLNDALYPHLVAISNTISGNKIRFTEALNSVDPPDDGLAPKFLDRREESESTRAKQKSHHRVGPMIKGMLITKPKIMLERVMLPQPQDQGSPNDDSTMIDGSNNLTTIPEEQDNEENLEMTTVTVRPRHKLGQRWHARRQGKLGVSHERGNACPSDAYNEESSDTESNVPSMTHMEPVVRIRDVSRLLQNSSLLKASRCSVPVVTEQDITSPSEPPFHGFTGREKLQAQTKIQKRFSYLIQAMKTKSSCEMGSPLDGDGGSGGNLNSKRTSTIDDPLEGASWMFTNSATRRNTFTVASNSCPRRCSSLDKSDSSDDEDNVIQPINMSNISTINTLVMNNDSSNRTSSERVSTINQSQNDDKSSLDSRNAEPDSTNNVDQQFNNSSDSFGSSSTFSLSGNELIDNSNGNENITLTNLVATAKRLESNVSSPTVCLSNVLRESSSLSVSNRKSSFCSNCPSINSSPDLGKRIRKPNPIYKEETYQTTTKKPKLTVGKKTSYQNQNSKSRKSFDKRRSSGTGMSGGESCVSSTKVNKKQMPPSTQSSTEKMTNNKRLSSVAGRQSEGKSSGTSGKKTNKKAESATEHTNKNCKRLSSVAGRQSEGKSSGTSGKKTNKKVESATELTNKNCKSSVKRSLNTPRIPSVDSGNPPSRPSSLTNQTTQMARSRRNKTNVSYKESPLNVKMRRR